MELRDHPSSYLERTAASVEHFLERRKILVLGVFTVLYFVTRIVNAHGKPFWFDEIIVLITAHQPSLTAAIKAARQLDPMPPFTHIVGYLVNQLAGSGGVAFRVPSMVGFWVFCLCLFGFAARRVGVLFALIALLLPFSTNAETYSTEARCYGAMLGFCGIALLSWQTAAAGERRTAALAGLFLGIAGALLTHYYAIMIYLPLAGGEILRSIRRRKIDWPVWTVFFGAALPAAASAFTALGVMQANPHPWSLVHPSNYLFYYYSIFVSSLRFAIPALVLLGLCFAFARKPERAHAREFSIPDHEWLAAILLLLIPVAAITLALAVPPHAFSDRYAIEAVGGFALLTAFLAAHLAETLPAGGLALLLAASLPFAQNLMHRGTLHNPFEERPMLVQALHDSPVAINNYVLFLQLWYYAPERMKSRLLYLSDEDSAVAFSHMDDIMSPLQQFGVPVVPYKTFAAPGREFLVYFTGGFGWVPEKVLNDGGTLQVLGWDQGDALLRARLK